MPDTARLAHSAGRQNHLGRGVRVDGLGFLAGHRQPEPGEHQGIDALLCQRQSFLIQTAVGALEEDAGGFNCQGAVHIHREIHPGKLLLLDLPQQIQHFLGPSHREGRDHQIAAAPQGGTDAFRQKPGRVRAAFMEPVAVGGLDDRVVRVLYIILLPQNGKVHIS